MGGVPTDSVVDLCGRPSATKVRPLDVPETCTLRVGSPVFQVSFANIPKETVRFHWGAYNAVGQCQSADTEYKTSQYFVLCEYQCTNELFCGFRVLTPDWCLIPLDVPGTCTLRIGLLCGALRKHGTPKETRVAANKKAPNGFGVQEFESVFLPNSKRKHAGLGRQCSASGAAAASNLQAALAQQQSVGPRGDTGDQRRDASRSGDEEEPQNAAGLAGLGSAQAMTLVFCMPVARRPLTSLGSAQAKTRGLTLVLCMPVARRPLTSSLTL
jgi:hypothetical protein